MDEDAVAALRLVVTRLARQLRQEALADHELTPTKLAVLASVNRLGPLSVRQLAEAERVSAPTVTRTVQALEGRGLIARHDDPLDGRLVRVTVTDAGAKLLRENRRRKDALLSQRLAQLTAADQATLLASIPVLQRLLGPEAPTG